MYGKFSVGFRVINERATTELQYKGTSLSGMCGLTLPVHMSILPGMIQMITPLAKSTPITQSSQMPVMSDTLSPLEIYWNQLPMSKQDPPIWRDK